MSSTSFRSDAASDDALRYLERCGLSRSQAIRAALVDFAEHRRREELVAEVKALASDEADQQEKATITALMDSLAVPVAHE
ncbi:MAG: hypothetical protein M3535_01075 [Actinomycetota bacterium]|nr:hypothetical protein [Actinomycetota bacterium]